MRLTKLHLSILLLLSQMASAQNTCLEAGLKFGYSSAYLYNKGIANWEYTHSKLRPGYGATVKIAANFGISHQIALEGSFHYLAHKFTYPAAGTATEETVIHWNTLSSGLFYRYSKSMIYLEIGPEVDFVYSVAHDGKRVPDGQYYRNRYLSGMVGFGGYLWQSGIISIETGVRLHGALTNFVTEEGAFLDYPIPQIGAISPVTDFTRPFRGEILLALNFALGESAKAMFQKRNYIWENF